MAVGGGSFNNGSADGKASTASNWSTGVVPGQDEVTDTVSFDNTTDDNCDWDITNTIAAFVISSDYDGTIAQSATLNVTDQINISGTGAGRIATTGSTINCGSLNTNGKATAIAVSAASIINVDGDCGLINWTGYATGSVVLTGSGVVTGNFYVLVQGNGITTQLISSSVNIYKGFITGDSTSILSSSSSTNIINFQSGSDFFTNNLPTWDASNGGIIRIKETSSIATIPADDYGAWALQVFRENATTSAAGDLLCRHFQVRGVADTTTFDMVTYDLTLTEQLDIGFDDTNRKSVFKAGTGTITVGTFIGVRPTTNTNDLQMESAVFNVSGDVYVGVGATVTEGTAVLNVVGSGDQDIMSSGESLHDIVINKSGGTFLLVDDIDVDSFETIDGNLNLNVKHLTAVNDVTLNNTGGDNINISNAYITITGDGTLTFGAGWGSATGRLSELNVLGDNTINHLRSVETLKLKCAQAGKTTLLTGLYPAAGDLDTDGGILTINSLQLQLKFRSGNYTLDQGATTINGTGLIFMMAYSFLTLTIEEFNYEGTGAVYIQNTTNHMIVDLAGSLTTGGNLIIRQSDDKTYRFNSNDFDITAVGPFYYGSSNANPDQADFYWGDSTITAASINTSDSSAYTSYLQTSTWICPGNYLVGHNCTIVEGTSKTIFNGLGVQNITMRGETLFDVDFTNISENINFVDGFSCTGLLTVAVAGNDINLVFDELDQHEIESWDLSTSGAGRVILNSSVSGNQADIIVNNNATVTGVTPTDINLTGSITDATDDTNTDGGNNTIAGAEGWKFTDRIPRFGFVNLSSGIGIL